MSTVPATIESLEAARNTARAAATHPRVLELRSVLGSPTATTPEKRKAQEELAALRPKRMKLLEQGGAGLIEAQAALSAARRGERNAAVEAIAVTLREQTTEQLEQLRASIEHERRIAKRNHRAVVKVLGEREAERRIADLVATLGDAEKRALLQHLTTSGVESPEVVGTPGAN